MKKLVLIVVLFLFSCTNNKIETNDSLPAQDIKFIKEIGLLNEGEKIIRFYSEYKNSVAGNFYTDKRIGVYWIDENDNSKNQKKSALYKEVIKLEPNYNPGLTYCEYVMVSKSDGSSFKVCMDGTKEEMEDFVNTMVSTWKKNR